MSVFSDDYYVLDFETGGFLNTSGGRPVEMAVLEFVDGKARITSTLVNPLLDDDSFQIAEQAENVHGISRALIEKEGMHPEHALRLFLEQVGSELPVWAHNGCGFDFPLHESESARYGSSSLERSRFRDSAALYKGWKMDRFPAPGENLHTYFTEVLRTRRQGLYFNLDFLSKELDLGVRRERGGSVAWDFSDLGLSEEESAEISSLGAHRAAFDCILTHALIQWMSRQWRGVVFDQA